MSKQSFELLYLGGDFSYALESRWRYTSNRNQGYSYGSRENGSESTRFQPPFENTRKNENNSYCFK